jgi:hypothetical protein
MMMIITVCLVILTTIVALPLIAYGGMLLMMFIGLALLHHYTYLGLFFASMSYYNDDPIWSCVGMALCAPISLFLYRVHKDSPF